MTPVKDTGSSTSPEYQDFNVGLNIEAYSCHYQIDDRNNAIAFLFNCQEGSGVRFRVLRLG